MLGRPLSRPFLSLSRRAEGLSRFVQSYRDLTKHMTARKQWFPLRRSFARLERLFEQELKDHDIAFVTDIQPETLKINADGELLDQALINLVRNAIDAVKDRPVRRISALAFYSPDGHIAVVIGDSSPGIPPEQREKIFIPFYTTKRHGSRIGPALVRQIALVHGGTVDVMEAPDGGAQLVMHFL